MKAFKKRNSPKWRAFFAFFIFFWAFMAIPLITNIWAASVTDGVQKFGLDNGFTVILREDHSSPVVAVQVWVKTGSANETEEEAGITHLIEHMIFKGTPKRKTGEIAKTIEASGGHINAYTSLDRTVYHVEIAGSDFDTALDVLLDAVQHSLFDPEEIEKEREVVLEEYRRSLDRPHTVLGWSMMGLCYQRHPYKRPIIGYESTIRSFDRKDILNYMNKWYTPDNMLLVAVGDFDADRALKTIRALIKDFPPRTGQKPSRAIEPEQTQLRKILLNREVQQVYLDMSWHIPPFAHRDLPALELLNIILGHGKSSRLYRRLKMGKNLVYSIDAGVYPLSDPGLFSIDATLSPENVDSALDAIVGETAKITIEPVSDGELARAKAIAQADFVFDMENMAGQARTLAFFETMTGDMYQADEYLELLRRVTRNDITRVASTYLRPKNLSIGLMAPKGSDIALSEQEIADLFSRTRSRPHGRIQAVRKEDEGTTKLTFPNGITVIVKENHHLPVVSVTGAFLGGARLEDPKPWGISGFVAKMLTRGTTKRSASEIASTVESWAGKLEGFSGRNSIGISAKFLSKDIYPGIELLADLILDPSFPESEVEKAREDILASIKGKRDRPVPQLFDLFYETLYKHHPYGHPLTGTEKGIQSIKRSDLVEWHSTFITPSNFVLAVVGDVNKNQLIPYINTLFGGFSPSPHKLPEISPEPSLSESREAHLMRSGAQTHLVIGYLGVDLKSKNNAPMALIETALSGQGGRLFLQVRDKLSLAYSVTAFRRPGLETGVFAVYLACDPQKLLIAKDVVFKELDNMRIEGLAEEELEAAKRCLLGNLRIGLQTNGSQAMHMALDELYGLGHDNIQQFIRNIEAVTPEDIKRAARDTIVPGKFTFVTIGPGPENKDPNQTSRKLYNLLK